MWWSSQGKFHIVVVLIGREMDLPSLKNDITGSEHTVKMLDTLQIVRHERT